MDSDGPFLDPCFFQKIHGGISFPPLADPPLEVHQVMPCQPQVERDQQENQKHHHGPAAVHGKFQGLVTRFEKKHEHDATVTCCRCCNS